MRSRPIEDFYLAADGDDWAPAVARAQAAWDGSSAYNSVISLTFGARRYAFLSKVDVYKRCSFIGENETPFIAGSTVTAPTTAGMTTLYFSASGGFECHGVGTYSVDLTAYAQCVHFENLIIVGAGSSSGTSRHGIIAHCPISMRNVNVWNFGGAGLLAHANTGAQDLLPVKGNTNNSIIQNCRFQRNGTVGTAVDGGDVNCWSVENCYWDDNGEYYAAGAITAATSAIYVKAASAAISSSAIASNVLTMNMGVAQSVHGYVIGDYIATSGMSANVTTAQVTGVSGNNVICALTAADNATNGAGTLWPVSVNNTVKVITVVLSTAADISKFDRGSVVTVTSTTLGAPYSSPGKKVFFAYSGVASGTASTITLEGDSSLTTGVQADGAGTVTGIAVQLFDSSTIFNQYMRPFFGNAYNDGYGIFSEGSGKTTFFGPYTEGNSNDAFYNNSSVIINGNCNINSSLSTDSAVNIRANEGCLDVYQGVRTHNAYSENVAGTLVSQLGSGADPKIGLSFTNVDDSDALYLYYEKSAQTTSSNSGGGWWEYATSSSPASYTTWRTASASNTRGDRSKLWLPNSGMYISVAGSNLDGGTASATPSLYIGTASIGSLAVRYEAIGEFMAVSGTASNGGLIRLTIADQTCVNGERLLVQGVAGTTAANGTWIVEQCASGGASYVSLTGSTYAGTYTSGSGRAIRVRATAFHTAAPSSGTWALGDVVWNKNPTTSGIIGWVCTVAGASGTWKAFTHDQEINLDSSLSYIGQTHTLRAALASGGAAGSGDTVTLLDTSPGLPYAIRVVDVTLYVSTAAGGSTCTLQDSDAAALSSDISSASTGVARNAHTATTTVAAAKGLQVVRSDRSVVGEIVITYVIT